MSVVTVERDRTSFAGHALIRVHGGARARTNPGFRLHRQVEWSDATLGPAGWQVAGELLTPARVTVEGEDLVLGVGPEVCSHVESGVYRIVVPAAGVDTVVVWPEIATPYTGRGGAFADPEERTTAPGKDAAPKNSIEPEQEAVPGKSIKPEKGAESAVAKGLGMTDRVAWGVLFGLLGFVCIVGLIMAQHVGPSSPPADFSQERWNRHDLAMLEGCWRNVTTFNTRDVRTGKVQAVSHWWLCFDRLGDGRQTVSWADGISCMGRIVASFSGEDHLRLNDTERCAGSTRTLFSGRFDCERTSDGKASCTRTVVEGPETGSLVGGRLMR
jgi:hypothetical protein